jgi:hypothetical protein
MNSKNSSWLIFAMAVCTLSVGAADVGDSRWSLDLGPSAWTNVDVSFGANTPTDPSTATKTDRVYDDGFNKIDSSGNLGDNLSTGLPGRTGNFGFLSDSQVDLVAGTLALRRASLAEGVYDKAGSSTRGPNLQMNLRVLFGASAAKRSKWGAEIGGDSAKITSSSSGVTGVTVRVLTDRYALGGVVPQRAPYAGRFAPSPGDQRIGDTPVRSITAASGTVSGSRSARATLTVLRAGGWWQVLREEAKMRSGTDDGWSLFVRGGLAVCSTKVKFESEEQLSGESLVAGNRVALFGQKSRNTVGGFAGVHARRPITSELVFVAGVDYLRGPDLSIKVGDRFARIDTSHAVIVRVALELGLGRRERLREQGVGVWNGSRAKNGRW